MNVCTRARAIPTIVSLSLASICSIDCVVVAAISVVDTVDCVVVAGAAVVSFCVTHLRVTFDLVAFVAAAVGCLLVVVVTVVVVGGIVVVVAISSMSVGCVSLMLLSF